MIEAKVTITLEYTSEDGLVYWTKIKRGKKRTADLGGTDSFAVVVRDVKQFLGIRTIKN